MRSCTFFGHRECPDSIRPMLAAAIIRLVYMEDVTMFYVGNQGHFDQIVLSVLRELRRMHDDFNYAVVLAYHPGERGSGEIPMEETMFPEDLEHVHPHFAVSRRNEWMLAHSEYVVAFVEHSWGGAAKYLNKARQKKKNIIQICKK